MSRRVGPGGLRAGSTQRLSGTGGRQGLQLSGHTHGGQLWPFDYLIRLDQPSVVGLSRHGDTQLYVSSGAGYWGPPMRVGARPEVTVVELRSPLG